MSQNIKIANICGLCAGCKHAIETAISSHNKYNNVVIFKEIVNNKNVCNKLANMGITMIDNLQDIPQNSTVVLRAHGEPPHVYDFLRQNNINYVDCTCINVSKIHANVKKYSEDGYTIALIGKYGKHGKMHPEILGTKGWSKTPVIHIEDLEDTYKIKQCITKKIYLCVQTTFNARLANEIIKKITHICKEQNIRLEVNNSVCGAQLAINKSAQELAKQCDVMIIVGGKNSSNAKELYNNINKMCPSIFIENINLWQNEFAANNIILHKNIRIGISAGASTLRDELIKLQCFIEFEINNLNNKK